MTAAWIAQAKALTVGSKRKIACCSADRTTFISNNAAGVRKGPCFRCGAKEFHPHGERSIQEVLSTRRAEDALSSSRTARMPTDAVAVTDGPKEAWLWLLRGGLTPEQATADHGMRWHEATRRLLIPVYDGTTLVAVVGRAVFGERPKYKMLGGRHDPMYRSNAGTPGVVFVVEDILSAIAVARAGGNSVAVLGTSITPVQAADIARGTRRVVGWFDNDPAGDKAWHRLTGRLGLHPVAVARIQTAKDPKLLPRSELRRLVAEHIGA